ncbi:MAG: hypothetical protein II208_00370 [Alphaproteobacteria bacterium]|nr:hypothetical protein [Alphaproteobacteria bacterium]
MVRIINIDTKTRTIRVSNGKDDLEWFTTDTGSHVPLKKGQSKAEAIKEHFGDKGTKKKTTKEERWYTKENLTKQLYKAIRKNDEENIQAYSLMLDGIDDERRIKTDTRDRILKAIEKSQQPAKQEPYSDPFHKEAEQKRNAAKDTWLKAKPQVDTKKLRAGDPETFEKYMDWRWQATSLSDGYDEMMKDFGGRDEFNKAAQAYEKLKQQPAKKETKSEDPRKANDGTNEKFHSMFEKFVPDSGPAETLFGEMLRAAARVKYRLFNDGDMYGHGYGKETVNNAMSYLGKLASGNDTEFKKELGRAVYQAVHAASQYDEEEYTKQVNRIYDAFADAKWDDIQNLIDVKNNTDSLEEYPDDTSYDDDEEDEEW